MESGTTTLGQGLYRLGDVARYTELHRERIRKWFVMRSDRRGKPVFTSDFPVIDGEHVVSFLDLMDARIVGQFRAEGVSMQVIRAAYHALSLELGTPHPFAHSALYTDGRRIFTDAASQVGDATLSDVVSRQTFFPRVRDYLTPIDYSDESMLAERWRIGDGVVMDPAIAFGQPVVRGTGVATYVAAMSYWANHGDCELVADLFGLTPTDVKHAVAFEERYGNRRAA